jgi:hypothetical protein
VKYFTSCIHVYGFLIVLIVICASTESILQREISCRGFWELICFVVAALANIHKVLLQQARRIITLLGIPKFTREQAMKSSGFCTPGRICCAQPILLALKGRPWNAMRSPGVDE